MTKSPAVRLFCAHTQVGYRDQLARQPTILVKSSELYRSQVAIENVVMDLGDRPSRVNGLQDSSQASLMRTQANHLLDDVLKGIEHTRRPRRVEQLNVSWWGLSDGLGQLENGSCIHPVVSVEDLIKARRADQASRAQVDQ